MGNPLLIEFPNIPLIFDPPGAGVVPPVTGELCIPGTNLCAGVGDVQGFLSGECGLFPKLKAGQTCGGIPGIRFRDCCIGSPRDTPGVDVGIDIGVPPGVPPGNGTQVLNGKICCPSGFKQASDGSQRCVKTRSTNFGNIPAARRAVRRLAGAQRALSSIEKLVEKSVKPRKAPRARSPRACGKAKCACG